MSLCRLMNSAKELWFAKFMAFLVLEGLVNKVRKEVEEREEDRTCALTGDRLPGWCLLSSVVWVPEPTLYPTLQSQKAMSKYIAIWQKAGASMFRGALVILLYFFFFFQHKKFLWIIAWFLQNLAIWGQGDNRQFRWTVRLIKTAF